MQILDDCRDILTENPVLDYEVSLPILLYSLKAKNNKGSEKKILKADVIPQPFKFIIVNCTEPTDTVEFQFSAKTAGEEVLIGKADFEFHTNSSPPLNGHVESTPITITIEQP